MARRTKQDAQLTRDAILDAAEVVFRDKGVAATRMEDIAKGADCTRGAVYWHFKNKTDVLVALSERFSMPLYDSITQILATRPQRPLYAWREHLRSSISMIETDPRQQGICDILINGCKLSHELEPLRDLDRKNSAFFIDSTRRLFELAQESGELRTDIDPATTALAVHAMVGGLIRLWFNQDGGFPLSDMVTDSTQLLLASLRTPS